MALFSDDKRLNVNVVKAGFADQAKKNHHYLSKCRMHEITPYDVSVFLDADTLVFGDLTPLWGLAEKVEFVVPQFSDWTSTGTIVSNRIMDWFDIFPEHIKPALAFGPALNTGVMGFTKNSHFMVDWHGVAVKGRHLFIPDETSCQLILYKYPHAVVDWTFNASCKYDKCRDPKVRVVHYHGRKHCRVGLPFHGDLWIKEYKEALDNDIAGIQNKGAGAQKHGKQYGFGPDPAGQQQNKKGQQQRQQGGGIMHADEGHQYKR